nr:MAG TPA: periplasmic binding protein domain protein [Crassvirales sp.]
MFYNIPDNLLESERWKLLKNYDTKMKYEFTFTQS